MTGGLNISGTGTIDVNGNVGPIGGIQQKMYAALRAGSKLFLAPSANCDEVIGHIPDGLNVIKVSTLAEAKSVVTKLAAGTSPASLPTCTK
jgi:PDZ domain-containing protein